MMDALLTVFLLAGVGLIFGATFPTGFAAVRQSGENTRAVALAEQKLEQVRSIPYEDLTYTTMRAKNMIDVSPTSSPYSFTEVDNVPQLLSGGDGTIAVTDETSSVKRVTVVLTYEGPNNTVRRTILRTLVADKRARVGP